MEPAVKKLIDTIVEAASELKSLTVSSGKNGEKFDSEKFRALEESQHKWQDMAISQLSFFNNLLIVLGTGFLGFAFKDSGLREFQFALFNASFAPTSTFLSLLFMTASVFSGLLCGYNRLLDFTHTHRMHYLKRKFYKINFIAYGDATEPYPIKKFLPYYWFKKPDFYTVVESEFTEAVPAVKKKICTMTIFVKRLGLLTRNLLRIQIVFFLMSITFFAFSFTGEL